LKRENIFKNFEFARNVGNDFYPKFPLWSPSGGINDSRWCISLSRSML
jgi:hypothetical protein